MAKRRLFETLDIVEKEINPGAWEMPNLSLLKKQEQHQFNMRKTAVVEYIKGQWTLDKIKSQTGISHTELYRHVKRCLLLNPNGQFIGFTALLPYTHLEPYHRSTTSDNGNAGKLRQLFNKYPDIEEYVKRLFYGKRIKGGIREPQMAFNIIHSNFLEKCELKGIRKDEYPFNTATQAREALRAYLQSLKDTNVRDYVQGRHGQDTARRIDATKSDEKRERERLLWEVTKPYQDIQLDEHVIHALMIIYVQAPDGIWIPQLFDRIWIIIPVDVASRAALGYQVCLTKYSSDDILTVLANSIQPNWHPRELNIPRLQYRSGAGFPSSTLKEYRWRLFDRLSMDNDKCHLSSWVQERITNVIGCTVNLGKKRSPETRGIIERLFKTLEDRGFHRITSTTGSNIKDTRRRHAERDAIQYEIHLNEIEEILDVLLANYNATPHSGCFGLSPLDYLKEAHASNSLGFVRTLPSEYREHIPLFDFETTRTVRGNIKNGIRAYIQYEGAIYKNDILTNTPSFIGNELTLIVNKKDLRIIRAYLANGAFFGFLRAISPWNRTKHSLRTRKAIIKCINNGKINRSTSDPIKAYHELLSKNSIRDRRERNKLTKLERETEIVSEQDTLDALTTQSPKREKQAGYLHKRGWIKIT